MNYYFFQRFFRADSKQKVFWTAAPEKARGNKQGNEPFRPPGDLAEISAEQGFLFRHNQQKIPGPGAGTSRLVGGDRERAAAAGLAAGDEK